MSRSTHPTPSDDRNASVPRQDPVNGAPPPRRIVIRAADGIGRTSFGRGVFQPLFIDREDD